MTNTTISPEYPKPDDEYLERDDEYDDEEFQSCDDCDGHDACKDYGCAIKLGLGHLVHPPL